MEICFCKNEEYVVECKEVIYRKVVKVNETDTTNTQNFHKNKLKEIMESAIHVQIFGSRWFTLFDDIEKSKITPNLLEKGKGIPAFGTVDGLEVDLRQSKTDRNSTHNCLLYVAEDCDVDFQEYLQAVENFAGNDKILIVNNCLDSKRWELVTENQENVFQYYSPQSNKEALKEISDAFKSLLLQRSLVEVKMW